MISSFFNSFIHSPNRAATDPTSGSGSEDTDHGRPGSNSSDPSTPTTQQHTNFSTTNPPAPEGNIQVILPVPALAGQRFNTIGLFREYINDYCRTAQPGYAVVTERSRKWDATLRCSRYGDPPLDSRRVHKCGCPFRIDGKYVEGISGFEFKVVTQFHNHEGADSTAELSYLRSPKVSDIERHPELATTVIISPPSIAKNAIKNAMGHYGALTTKDVVNLRRAMRRRAAHAHEAAAVDASF
jgi:hypothetical protein